MDKIKYIPLTLFALFSAKCLFLGVASYESAFALLILGLVAAYYEFKSQDRIITEFKKELDETRSHQKKLESEMEALKSYVSSIKLSNQFRQQKAL
jgi:hypothetical protein